jgi:site-specific DNA-methyltransferase (adenine-specific)
MKVYEDEFVTVYHDSWQNVLETLERVDVVITDPPYGSSTHDGAMTLKKAGQTDEVDHDNKKNPRSVARKLVDFAMIGYDDFEDMVYQIGMICQRWFVMTCEMDYTFPLKQACAADGFPVSFIRKGVFVKPNGAPQVSGDRPAQGYEEIAILHRKNNGRLRWNGGGKSSVYTHNKPNKAEHPTQKPLGLYVQFVRDFSNVGETIFDPFGGSGTLAVAAKMYRRKCIIVEREEKYIPLIIKNVMAAQPMSAAMLETVEVDQMKLTI